MIGGRHRNAHAIGHPCVVLDLGSVARGHPVPDGRRPEPTASPRTLQVSRCRPRTSRSPGRWLRSGVPIGVTSTSLTSAPNAEPSQAGVTSWGPRGSWLPDSIRRRVPARGEPRSSYHWVCDDPTISRHRMSTSAGSRSASRTTFTSSRDPDTSRPITTGVPGSRCSNRGPWRRPARCGLRGGVVNHRAGRPPRRRSAVRRSRPTANRSDKEITGVVVAQRRADPAGGRLRRRHCGYRGPARRPLLGFFEHGRGHAKTPGSPDDTTATARPPRRVHAPAGRVPVRRCCRWGAERCPSADPFEVRAVSDEVGGRGQFVAALRGHPVGVARARGRQPRCPSAAASPPRYRAAWRARSTAPCRRRPHRRAALVLGVLARST